MKNKDNNKYPEYIQEIIDKAIKDGADVQVVKVNREGNEREIFSSKKQKVLDEIDSIGKKLDSVSEQDILDRLARTLKNMSNVGLDATEIYDVINKLFMKLVANTPEPPKRAIGIILGQTPDDLSIMGYSFKNKKEAARVLRAVADGLESDGFTEKEF